MLSWFVDPVTRSTLTDAIRAQNPCTVNGETSCNETPVIMIPLAALLGSQGPLHQNPPHCMLNIRTGRHLRLIKVSKTSDDSDKFYPEKSWYIFFVES